MAGKLKENPRYNVITSRVDDRTFERLCKVVGRHSFSDFIRQAVENQLDHAEQSGRARRINDALSRAGRCHL